MPHGFLTRLDLSKIEGKMLIEVLNFVIESMRGDGICSKPTAASRRPQFRHSTEPLLALIVALGNHGHDRHLQSAAAEASDRSESDQGAHQMRDAAKG